MAANTASLRLVQPRGWTSGLGNFVARELGGWWTTRFWMIQAVIWAAAINAIPVMVLWVAPATDPNLELPHGGLYAQGLQVFFEISAQFAAGAVAILGMGAIIGEVQSGTAAWLLSKPLSRRAFIIAKLVALGVGTLSLCVLVPGAAAYAQIAAATGQLPPLVPFALGLALVGLHTLMYVCLTLMLGAFVRSRGAVVGIALALLFGQNLVSGFVGGSLASLLPHRLGALAASAALEQPLPSYAALGSAAILSMLFAAGALWRFGREEL
jgi:ABC-2 type transport system permease protein